MAIAGATAASMTVAGHSLPVVLLAALAAGALAGLWNGILVAVQDPALVATLILMVAGRGVAQLITAGQIVTFDSPALAWLGSGSFLLFPTPVIVAAATLLLFWLFTRKTALGMFEAVGSTSARRKRRRQYPHRGDAGLCPERRLRGDRRDHRGGGHSRRGCQTPGYGLSWTPFWRWSSAAPR